jgi:hypothetical protein
MLLYNKTEEHNAHIQPLVFDGSRKCLRRDRHYSSCEDSGIMLPREKYCTGPRFSTALYYWLIQILMAMIFLYIFFYVYWFPQGMLPGSRHLPRLHPGGHPPGLESPSSLQLHPQKSQPGFPHGDLPHGDQPQAQALVEVDALALEHWKAHLALEVR